MLRILVSILTIFGKPLILVHSCCYNKTTMNRVAYKPHSFLTVLETRKFKIMAPAMSLSGETLCPRQISMYSHTAEGNSWLCEVSFVAVAELLSRVGSL